MRDKLMKFVYQMLRVLLTGFRPNFRIKTIQVASFQSVLSSLQDIQSPHPLDLALQLKQVSGMPPLDTGIMRLM